MTAAVTDAAPSRRRGDDSMSLLVDIQTERLDMAYVEAAARRAGRPVRGDGRADGRQPVVGDGGQPVAGAGTPLRSVLLIAVIGVLIGTAAAQLRGRQAAENGARTALLVQVAQRTAESDRLATATAQLRAELASARDAALGADQAARTSAERLALLELAAGTVPVRGPGIHVRIDDAAPGARAGATDDGRVLDRDLQDLANGLWAAGAEAVSVNGLRLTARTAIRSAGEAILVDFRPLRPPYVLAAIGDPGRLETDFVDGATGRRFATYSAVHDLDFEVSRSERLELAGSSAPDLRSARSGERAGSGEPDPPGTR